MDLGQILHSLLFYLFAAIILGSGLVVARARNLVYAALGLLFTFFGVAAIFVFAHADFVAGIQVVVYIGGILVLILFGIMLTRRVGGVKVPNEITGSYTARLIPILVTGLLLTVVLSVDWTSRFTGEKDARLWSRFDENAPASVKKKNQQSSAQAPSGAEQSPKDTANKDGDNTPESWGTINLIGESMMNKYLVAFEEISVLLLIALLGAVYLARRPTEERLEEAKQALQELEEGK